MYARPEKPAFLVRYETDARERARRNENETRERRRMYQRNARQYERVTFWRASYALRDFFKRDTFEYETLADAQNAASDSYYSGDDARDYFVREYGDEAVALFRYMCPDAPVDRYRATIESDLARAAAFAACDDYGQQFFHWCRVAIENVARNSDFVWCWLDADGRPTDQEYDAHAVGFACSRRAYLDRSAAWWPELWWNRPRTEWDNYDSNRERIEAAEDVLGDYLSSYLKENAINPEDFDARGSRYADPQDWPMFFIDYSEAIGDFRADRDRMRERLREMIRARAPLEARAALVASVYGWAGNDADADENE